MCRFEKLIIRFQIPKIQNICYNFAIWIVQFEYLLLFGDEQFYIFILNPLEKPLVCQVFIATT